MISLQSLTLILALYGLGTQAVPTQAAKTVEVSILDLVRNGEVKESGSVNVTYKHSLPEPNRDDQYEVDGITFYRLPEGGVDVHPDFWEERSISLHNATNSSSLETRQTYISPTQQCEPCKCPWNMQVWYEWQTQNWNRVQGNMHQISDPLCAPGSISKSYTKSWSYQMSVQAGPDFKLGLGILEKFAIRVGFAYTWGHAVTTAYTASWTSPGQYHPFIETFRPNIFVVNGIAKAHHVDHYYNNKACSVSDWSHINLHLPLVKTENNDCKKSDSSCGADGTYDSCFYVGKYAAALCPGRKLGPWPAGRTCPSYLYPSPFDKND